MYVHVCMYIVIMFNPKFPQHDVWLGHCFIYTDQHMCHCCEEWTPRTFCDSIRAELFYTGEYMYMYTYVYVCMCIHECTYVGCIFITYIKAG